MRFKIVFIVFILYCISGFSCSSIESHYSDINKLRYVNEDYSRNDLFFIMGIESGGVFDCVWKISDEELSKEKMLTLSQVLADVSIPELSKLCEFFLQNGYDGRYKDRMFFVSFEIVTVNKDQYGTSVNVPRNDWILVMTYEDGKKTIDEKIFLTPSKRIILSSTGYEDVKF